MPLHAQVFLGCRLRTPRLSRGHGAATVPPARHRRTSHDDAAEHDDGPGRGGAVGRHAPGGGRRGGGPAGGAGSAAQGDRGGDRRAARRGGEGHRRGRAGRDGLRAGHRAAERFPMTSTFKLLAAAAVLRRVDAGQERLDRVLRFSRADLVTYSPVTGPQADGPGMTLEALCEAIVTLSDNTAGNLVLGTLGGPAGLTAFARSLGDTVTRLDRLETALNEAAPGDPRDTTSPEAMLGLIEALTVGEALSAASRDRLVGWLLGSKTGDNRLRAGLPPGWRAAGKTGSGGRNTSNDVGLLLPPDGRAPVLVAVYLTGATAPAGARDAAIAEVARAVVRAVG
nr:class A beta-lactamase [Pseudoroseomonas rhizosphaerae]